MLKSLLSRRSDKADENALAKRSQLNIAPHTKGPTPLSRRSLFFVGIGAVAATLSVGVYKANVEEERLTTDPSGTQFVYRDGVITRVN